MHKIEAELEKLNAEADALKQSFERAAYSVEVYETKKTVSFGTDTISASNTKMLSGVADIGRGIVVTYNTYSGDNVLAKILPKGRRVPYSGGARWYICPDLTTTAVINAPVVDTSSFEITVFATAPGEILVEQL